MDALNICPYNLLKNVKKEPNIGFYFVLAFLDSFVLAFGGSKKNVAISASLPNITVCYLCLSIPSLSSYDSKERITGQQKTAKIKNN